MTIRNCLFENITKFCTEFLNQPIGIRTPFVEAIMPRWCILASKKLQIGIEESKHFFKPFFRAWFSESSNIICVGRAFCNNEFAFEDPPQMMPPNRCGGALRIDRI